MHLNKGQLTPSMYANIMTRGRGGVEYGAAAMTAATRIAMERIGVQIPPVTSWAMEHGNNYEPEAIEAYEAKTGTIAIEPDEALQHPEIEYIAGTPDGIVGDDGIIEVKCPYNPANHLANILTGEQLNDYKWQIQGYLAITGRKWCDFVSYGAHFPDDLKLHIIRVDRDELMIAELLDRLAAFELIVRGIVEQVEAVRGAANRIIKPNTLTQ